MKYYEVHAKILDVEHLQMFQVKLPEEEKKNEKNSQKRILSFHEALGPILTGLL